MYVQLGQMDMAAKILAAANDLAELNNTHIDTPTLVLLRLLYADMLARNRETEQRCVMFPYNLAMLFKTLAA